MSAYRRREPTKAWLVAFAVAVFALVPTDTGFQDIAGLLARQPGVKESWQKHAIASPFGTIHAATFSFSRPVGAQAPEFQLASLTARDANITGLLGGNPDLRRIVFPQVDRSGKGDRLPLPEEPAGEEVAAPASPEPSPPPAVMSPGLKTNTASLPPAIAPRAAREETPLDPELAAALSAEPLPQYEAGDADTPFHALKEATEGAEASLDPQPEIDGFTVKNTRLFFGHSTLGPQVGSLRGWGPGEAPVVLGDPDLKQSAALPAGPGKDINKAGESVAGKGEVNTAATLQKSPAERLALDARARIKAEKCLADAVYFESRGESVRGQIAVAQVVMNRVFSGFYPNNVCGVVYQNAHRHLSCQFTFACDGIRDVVKEPEMWERAKKIAKETLDGRLWLPEVGKSTHYHAYWVRPSWTREMRKLYKVGVHTFYRPRNWGDGAEMPAWSTPAMTAEIAAKL